MNWEAVGAAAELLAAAGVIVSLLYLASQLRQSNRLARRSAVQSHLAARGEFNRLFAGDAELNEFFWRGMDTPSELTPVEWRRFLSAFSTLARHCEAIFLDHEEGLLPERVWKPQDSSMKRWMSYPGAQRFFKELEADFDPGFLDHVRQGEVDAA